MRTQKERHIEGLLCRRRCRWGLWHSWFMHSTSECQRRVLAGAVETMGYLRCSCPGCKSDSANHRGILLCSPTDFGANVYAGRSHSATHGRLDITRHAAFDAPLACACHFRFNSADLQIEDDLGSRLSLLEGLRQITERLLWVAAGEEIRHSPHRASDDVAVVNFTAGTGACPATTITQADRSLRAGNLGIRTRARLGALDALAGVTTRVTSTVLPSLSAGVVFVSRISFCRARCGAAVARRATGAGRPASAASAAASASCSHVASARVRPPARYVAFLCCTMCANSCASNLRPLMASGAYRPLPNTTSCPTV